MLLRAVSATRCARVSIRESCSDDRDLRESSHGRGAVAMVSHLTVTLLARPKPSTASQRHVTIPGCSVTGPFRPAFIAGGQGGREDVLAVCGPLSPPEARPR